MLLTEKACANKRRSGQDCQNLKKTGFVKACCELRMAGGPPGYCATMASGLPRWRLIMSLLSAPR